MPSISAHDGQYALDCWLDEDDEGDPVTEYAESIPPLEKRALTMIEAGRYRYIELSRWDAASGDWANLRIFTPET